MACNSARVCFRKILGARDDARVRVRQVCLQKPCEVARSVLSPASSCHREASQKQAPGHDRDRATAAFWWCNRKLIETINMVLIIKAQVLRWHFADCSVLSVVLTYMHIKSLTRCFARTWAGREGETRREQKQKGGKMRGGKTERMEVHSFFISTHAEVAGELFYTW